MISVIYILIFVICDYPGNRKNSKISVLLHIPVSRLNSLKTKIHTYRDWVIVFQRLAFVSRLNKFWIKTKMLTCQDRAHQHHRQEFDLLFITVSRLKIKILTFQDQAHPHHKQEYNGVIVFETKILTYLDRAHQHHKQEFDGVIVFQRLTLRSRLKQRYSLI